MSDCEIVQLPDGGGNHLKAMKYQGRLWPAFSPDSIKGVETFKSRQDDVIVVAYPKSGTHWVWEMVRLLMAGTTDVPVVEKDDGMIEDVLPENLESQSSPRILNTHAHFELMPRDVLTKKDCKLVYVTRDPRDVAVSYFNHHRKLVQYYSYEGQWKDYLPMFLAGNVDYESWFAYTRGWEQGMKDNPDLQVHVTSYEALHESTSEELEKLARYLGASTEKQFLSDIVKKTSFDSMKATKGKTETFKEKDKTEAPIMYRKGKVGDWKNWFTVAQSEQFDATFEQQDTREEINKMAKFLGVTADPTFVDQIVGKSSFDHMRKTKGGNETFEGNEPSSPVMYRKGKVGDWKNWFTVAQSEQFNAALDQEMRGTRAFELYSHSKLDQGAPDGNMNER